VLRDEDMLALRAEGRMAPPDAFSAHVTLASSSAADVARGDFRVLLAGAAGPTGARVLARFCHGDAALEARVQELVRREEARDAGAVHAEIVHLPQDVLGNVVARPRLRDFEIVYLGESTSGARRIPITDLLVRVTGGRIQLWSSALGREVKPRLTNAHGFGRHGLPLYTFLCLLQDGGHAKVPILRWEWGGLDALVFLPRVRRGRCVLSLARWRITRDILPERPWQSDVASFRTLRALRERYRIPRHVALVEGDASLPIDLDNIVAVRALLQVVRNRDEFVLTERAAADDELIVSGPEGRFVHDMVVPFVRRREDSPLVPKPEPAISIPAGTAKVATTWQFPGGEWTYFKLYCGHASADDVLSEVVAPVVRTLTGEGLTDRWFFLRYGDPDWHVRVRCHATDERLAARALTEMSRAAAPFIAEGRVHKVQLDTYKPEIERYGGLEGLRVAEKAFCIDSDAALDLLARTPHDSDARWITALVAIDDTFDACGLDVQAKLESVSAARANLVHEFGVATAFERTLGAKFRTRRALLEQALRDRAPREDLQIAPILASRRALLRNVGDELATLAHRRRLTAPVASIASSLVHMCANRLLHASARAQELVLYDFLQRLYQSTIARGRS